MEIFRELDDRIIRQIDRTMLDLARLETLEDLQSRFVPESEKILPADCLCWNNWSRDLGHLISFQTNSNYMDRFTSLQEAFGKTVGNHPVIASNNFAGTTERVMQISDFVSPVRFKENPLFREVYRHLDSLFQIAYTPSVLQDRRILLTWNRRALDFTERDRQIFEYMGLQLGIISHRIAERQRLESAWKALCRFVDRQAPAAQLSDLGSKDITLVTQLLKGRPRNKIAADTGVRRDTLDKRLGSIRERLGLENHHQLLTVVAKLRVSEKKSGSA